MEHGLILSTSSYFLWTGVWSIFCSSSGGGNGTCFCSRLHPRKLRWNLKIHRFCRFFGECHSNSTTRCDVRHQVGRISSQAAKACLAHSALVVRAPVVRALAWLCRLCRLCLCLVAKACLACLTTRGMAAVAWISKACKACSPWIRWECNKGPAWLNSHLPCTIKWRFSVCEWVGRSTNTLRLKSVNTSRFWQEDTSSHCGFQIFVYLLLFIVFFNGTILDLRGSLKNQWPCFLDKKNYSKAVCVFFKCFLVTPNFRVFF